MAKRARRGREPGTRLRRGDVEVVPLTAERWKDFERLFGPRGACGGCWCMTPRLSRAEYERQKGEGNRRAMRRLVRSGRVPGVIAYEGGQPIGWCSIEPRSSFPTLGRSRILRPIDERPVWSIVCLFVAPDQRGRGVSRILIDGAVAHARANGARMVEAYPVEPRKRPMPAVFAYTGIASAFLGAGFREVERRSPTRPIVRRQLRSS
jgi:GNAT superfamily N-acetyltransferase